MASFVNEAFEKAINDYVSNKANPECVTFNSFFAVVIRQLTFIYDELDIINPYSLKDEGALNNNLSKYGYDIEHIKEFKDRLDSFYKNANEEDFVFIQKSLIDMFICKKNSMNLSDSIINSYRSMIYSPYALSPLMVSYNFLMNSKPNSFIDYLEEKLNSEEKKEISKPKEKLNIEAYQILKYSMDDIKKMSAEELDSVNKKVYNFFNISDDAINKSYLLDKAVYDFKNPKASLTTGNGFVDLLFILSLVATVGMIVLIITLIFL